MLYYIIYMHGSSNLVQEAVEKKWKMNSKDFNARAMAAMGDPEEAVASDVGVSENSVPLKPLVNDHYPY